MKHKAAWNKFLCLLMTLAMLMSLCPAYAEGTVAELEDGIYTIPGVDTNLLRQNGGKFYPATATKTEADALADTINRQINDEGQVLLHNDGVLPLDSHDKRITLMGVASQDVVVSGGGSGRASQNAQSTAYNWNNAFAEEGFSVNPTIVSKYANYLANDVGSNGLHVEMPVSELGATETATYKGYGDAAVLVLYRWSQENADLATYNAKGHSDPNDTELDLQDNEKDLIRHAKAHFDKVIVLINSSYTMDVSELADESSDLYVDAILWVGGVGQVGCLEAVKILEGKVNPSGRLPDTWWADLKKDPAFPNVSQMNQNAEGDGRADAFFRDPDGNQTPFALVEYREGIYMGHRYYETVYDDLVAAGKADEAEAFYKETVAFPFGYGLSYTDFTWELAGVSKNRTIESDAQYLTVQVAVTNAGNRAGKDVVELYSTPPYTPGGIEKASAALVGFAKTKELQPGETDVVTIQILAHDLASYDWDDKNDNGFIGYELEKGTYVLSLRRNAHDVVIPVEFTVASDITCPIDLQSGSEVTNVFTDDDWMNFEVVREDYLDNLISREDGLEQPKPVSLEDRTLTSTEYALLLSEEFYYPYMDNPDQPWFVAEGGIPDNWTQAAEEVSTEELTALRAKLPGVEYTEPELIDGVLSFDHLTDEQKEANALWDAYMNALTYDQLVSYYASAKGPLSGGLTGSDGPVTFGGGADWPTCPISAATWNLELLEQQGEMLGTQAMLNGTTGWRGGGLDTHRTPFNGRCFEYYSEDGVLAAYVAKAVDTGVTSKGIMCYWKHYFNNDQEYRRANFGGVSVFCTEQAMREIYLKPFEAVIKNGTAGVMTSFNRFGFIVNSNNYASHQKLMRDEWGYRGGTVNDQWAKTYVSQDLMVRAGDTYLMGGWNSFATTGLTWGKWDASLRDGKGLPLVPDADAANQNVQDGTVPSETQYYVMRLAALRDARNEVNSAAMKNNVSEMSFNAVAYAGANNYKAIVTSPDTTNFTITGFEMDVDLDSLEMGAFDGVEPAKESVTTSSGWSQTTVQQWTYACDGFTVVETRDESGANVTSTQWTYPDYSVTQSASQRSYVIGDTSVTLNLAGGNVVSTTYTKNGLTLTTGSNAVTVSGSVALGEYAIPVTVTCDNWVLNAPATINLKVVSPLTVNGADVTNEPITVKAGAQNIEIASDYYAFMNKNGNSSFLVMPAYNDGSGWKQRTEDESASDIITLDYDAIKDLDTFEAHEPKYEIVGELPAGLTATPIMTKPVGYCGLTYSSDINVGLNLSGELAAGTYTFTVKLTTYTISKPTGGNWIRSSAGTEVVVEQPVTLVVE